MKYIIILTLFCFPLFNFSQRVESENKIEDSENKIAEAWLTNLTTKGIEVQKDTILISKEYKRALSDKNYRKVVYPKKYFWKYVEVLIKGNQLKIAFWHIINLYPKSSKDKEIALKFILTYDKLFPMDEILVSTFYTYSFMDPETSVFKSGEPETTRPDILEEKLRNVNEMVAYILKFRAQKKLESNKSY